MSNTSRGNRIITTKNCNANSGVVTLKRIFLDIK